MRNISFDSFDALLNFLLLCEEHGLLGTNREIYEWIYVDPGPRYTITYEAGPQDDAEAAIYAGKLGHAYTEKNRCHINQLLLKLPLQPQEIGEYAPSLFLLSEYDQDTKNSTKRFDRVYKAWNDIPKSATSESYFVVVDKKYFAVEIPEIDPKFRLNSFRKRLPNGVKLFLPAWSDETGEKPCFLYVEAGLRYPKPTEFALLYDEETFIGENQSPMEFDHIVLLEGAQRLDHLQPEAKTPRSHLIEVRNSSNALVFTRSHDIYELESSEFLSDLAPAFSSGNIENRIHVPLTIEPASQFTGSRQKIEAKIGQLQKALEIQLEKQARLASLEEDDYVPIYRFPSNGNETSCGHDVVIDGNPPLLPAELIAFLNKPLSELKRYRYTRTEGNPGIDHWIISDIRMPLSEALAVGHDKTTYLCPGRWIDLGLELFVRADSALSYRYLNERGLIEKIQEYLDDELAGSPGGCYRMAEPLDQSSREASSVRLRTLDAEKCEPIDEVLRFINPATPGVRSIVEHATPSMDEQQRAFDIAASESAYQHQTALHQRAQDLTHQAEERWEQVRQRAHATFFKAAFADISLQATDEAYQHASEEWLAYVKRVAQLNATLGEDKIHAIEEWIGSDVERARLLNDIQTLETDVEQEIRSKTASLTELLPKIDANMRLLEDWKDKSLKPLAQQVIQQKEEYDQAFQQCNEMREALRFGIEQFEAHQEELKSQIAQLNKELDYRRDLVTRCHALEGELDQLEFESFQLKEEALEFQSKLAQKRRVIRQMAPEIQASLKRWAGKARKWLHDRSELRAILKEFKRQGRSDDRE